MLFHASRAFFRKSPGLEKNLIYVGIYLALIIAIEFVFLITFSYRYPQLIWLAIPSALILMMIGLCVWVLKNIDKLFVFYQRLAEARASERYWNKEFVESYRHLREHGNSFGIVLAEIAFGAGFYSVGSFGPIPLILFIGAWAIPPTMIWLVGTFLESRFVGNDD